MLCTFRIFLVISLVLAQFAVKAQEVRESCPEIKDGTFYSYPANSNDQWKSERAGDVQKEINLVTGDTLFFKVNWEKNCSYTLKYQSGGKKLKREELEVLKQYAFVFTVSAATPDYYVSASYLESAKNYPVAFDTMWRQPRPVAANRVIFTNLNPAEQRKAKLKDTSQFALLYVYRPSKFMCSAVGFPLYANDILMAGFPPKGGAYVFKLWRQGRLRLQGQHRQAKDYVDIDVRFGQKYFVRVDTKWSLARCIPFLVEKDKEKGEEEFLEAQ